jgi:FkbM family methyltransferase
MYCGLPIIAFDEFKKRHRESLILIASAAYQNFVKKQLLDNGFPAERIVTLDTNDSSPDAQIKRERILMLARNGEASRVLDELRKDEDRIADVFNLLADEKSKALFVRRLALIASGYEGRMYRAFLEDFSEPVLQYGYDNPERLTKPGSYFYFNNDVLRLEDNEVLVDGGAFSGDSTDEFVRACKKNHVRYKHVVCFEPDLSNYGKLIENTSKYRDVTCLRFGLWSHRATLRFVSSAQTESYCARVQEASAEARVVPDMEIETADIDGQLPCRDATFIKMDIEGAEMEAIQGAADTIRSRSPKLALSVYHNTGDLYEIPLLVHQLNPGYKLYLRHFGNYFDDTVLCAAEQPE